MIGLARTARPVERLHLFLHVATLGRYQIILPEIVEALVVSGLRERAAELVVGVVGDGEIDALDAAQPTLIVRRDRLEEFEFPTLALLQRRMAGTENAAALYLHLKGVSVPPHKTQKMTACDDWRRYMTHFLVRRFKECVAQLATHDVCGVDWRPEPVPHFSGNFWWARGDYIATLPRIEDIAREDAPYVMSRRHNAEFWIGMNPLVRAHSLFDCGVRVASRYNYPFPERFYEGKTGHIGRIGKAFLVGHRLVRGPWPRYARLRRAGAARQCNAVTDPTVTAALVSG